MILIRNSSKLLVIILVLAMCTTACKSKKKAMEANRLAAEKARTEQEAANRRKEEEQKKKEAEEAARREAEAKQNQAKVAEPRARLNQYFDSITGNGNVASANSSINEALALFASPETPVLIVISEENGQKDYDRPTTIKEYLNYLKDQKKNINTISDLKFNNSGKITEVELKKSL